MRHDQQILMIVQWSIVCSEKPCSGALNISSFLPTDTVMIFLYCLSLLSEIQSGLCRAVSICLRHCCREGTPFEEFNKHICVHTVKYLKVYFPTSPVRFGGGRWQRHHEMYYFGFHLKSFIGIAGGTKVKLICICFDRF